MEVKSDILEKLRCEQCTEYLSCGPVTINSTGASICGRCYNMDQQLVRNYAYEHLATHTMFPCRFAAYGCMDKWAFPEVKSHEDTCKHKHYSCPVANASGGCHWQGHRNELIEHCKSAHAETILPPPYVLEHDVHVESQRSFILILYNVLFLLQTKVNLMAGKIYHSLQCFASEQTATGFSFQLIVKNAKGRIIKDGVVLSRCVDVLDESNSVVTKINGLVDIMSSYEGISFTIQLVRNRFSTVCSDSETESDSDVRISLRGGQEQHGRLTRKEEDSYYLEPIYVEKKHMYTYIQICSKCKANMPQPVYQTGTDQLCIQCAPRIFPCKNRSKRCEYMDISTKANKHSRYLCKYTTWCWLCQWDYYMPIVEHYLRDHDKLANGEEWLATSSAGWKSYIVSHENIVFILEYFLSNNELQFNVRSSLRSKEMYEYACELLVSNAMTKRSLKKTLKCHYELWRDWTTHFDKTELKLLLHNGQCEMNLYIIKKN